MLAFQIEIDGGEPFVLGQDDWYVLSMHITASGGNNPATNLPQHLGFSVNGLTQIDGAATNQHFRWPARDLTIGSTVRVTIVDVETSTIDPIRFQYNPGSKEVELSPEEIEACTRKAAEELQTDKTDSYNAGNGLV